MRHAIPFLTIALSTLLGCAPAMHPAAGPAPSGPMAVAARTSLAGAHGLEVRDDGAFVVADTFGPTKGLYQVAPPAAPAPLALRTPLVQPAGLRYGRDGHLYVCDLGANRVVRIAADGGVEVVADDVPAPWNLAFRSDGAMVVACHGGAILLIDGDRRETLHTSKASPFDVEVDAKDRIFVSLQGEHQPGQPPAAPLGRVVQLSGGRAVVWAKDLWIPEGLALGPDGALYVADTHAGSIHRIAGRNAVTAIAQGLRTPIHLAVRQETLFALSADGGVRPVAELPEIRGRSD